MVSSVRRCTEYMSPFAAQGQCHYFMPSLEGYSFSSGYILTEVKENAHNTLSWPFMVPVMGLITFAFSIQRYAWMPLVFYVLFNST